jgi:hypothetical protein
MIPLFYYISKRLFRFCILCVAGAIVFKELKKNKACDEIPHTIH